jgi:hypothetical protein
MIRYKTEIERLGWALTYDNSGHLYGAAKGDLIVNGNETELLYNQIVALKGSTMLLSVYDTPEQKLDIEIINLWHISRPALCMSVPSRHERMLYVKQALRDNYPELLKLVYPGIFTSAGTGSKALWLRIESLTSQTY